MYNDQPMTEKSAASIGNARQETVTERLKNEKAHLEDRLKQITEAIESLEAHPEVQTVVDTLQKLGGARIY